MELRSVEKLLEEILITISDDYEKSPGNIIYDLSRAFALQKFETQKLLSIIESKSIIENLTTEELTRYVWQRKGIKRKPFKCSTGLLNVIGTGEVSKGRLFETEIGTQFIATETVQIIESGTVNIEAVIGGVLGNVGANTITLIPITIQGINSVVNLTPTIDGYEEESNESLIERYYTELQKPATSGNIYHYLLWAREVVGIGNVKAFPLEHGANTVELVVLNDYMLPASEAIINVVQNYIDPGSSGRGEGQAPIGAKCYVISALALLLNIQVSISKTGSKTDEQLKVLIENAIKDYLKSIAFKQDSISYAKIGSLILSVDGIEDYTNLTVNGGMTKVDISAKEVATLGGVTFV